MNEINSDKRLIDFWIDAEEKKKEPKPTPMFNLVWDSFFGWVWYVYMALFLVLPGLAYSQDIQMPDSWNVHVPRTVFYNDCCCDTGITQAQMTQLQQSINANIYRPSTLQEIHETHFSNSSSLSDTLSK